MESPGMEIPSESWCAMRTVSSVSSSEEEVTIKYVCGIDGWRANPVRAASVGQRSVWWSSQATSLISKRDGRCGKRNWRELDATPNQIIIGMEATSRYHENLYHELEQKGYQMRLLHPGQTHHFHQQQGRLVLATWDIRSGKRHDAHDGAGFLAGEPERRVQSTRSLLLVRSATSLP